MKWRMALNRTLGCRFGYCTYTAHAVVGRAGQARRAARCSNCCGAFPRGFFLFFFPFFFSNREQVPPVWHGPRDLNLSGPAHAAGAYLSIVDPTMRVSSSYPFHRRIIVARLRRHRRRPTYHPHKVIVVTMLTPTRYQLQRWSLPSINARWKSMCIASRKKGMREGTPARSANRCSAGRARSAMKGI